MKGHEVSLTDVEAKINRLESISPELKAFSEEWEKEYQIRKQLRMAREESGINQKVLGMLSGLDQRAISRVETNTEISPSLKTIIKYLNAIGYELQVVKGEQRPLA